MPLALFIYFIRFVPAIQHHHTFYSSLNWLPALGIQLSFYLDGLSNLFALLISGIGIFIVLYSGTYLRGNPQLGRFYAYLFFFMGAMLGVVLADNLMSLFIFWELTSLSSFLLISFDHQRKAARRAALQGLLVTVAGGLALLTGFILLKIVGHSFNLTHLTQTFSNGLARHHWYTLITLLILIGAATKSAQFPFHFWLPNAMQAPTPVSAYLHSATMVQAGVYLIARFTPLLGHTQLWFTMLVMFGSFTMLCTLILALQSSDIKRMLAYSTTMALGMLFFLLASDDSLIINAAMLFFFAHALYKAGLFLAAGNIDHATGTRDLYKLGGLYRYMPITLIGTLLCAASMAGLPPLLGFISKELIYEAKLNLGWEKSMLLLIALLCNIVFVIIAIMIVIKPFFSRQIEKFPYKPHEQSWQQWLGLLVLAGGSLFLGLFPRLIDNELVYPATFVVTGKTINSNLSLWHGITPAFLLSVITLLCGIGLFMGHKKIYMILQTIRAWSIEKTVDRCCQGFVYFANFVTVKIQSGYLSRYLATILAFIAISVGVILFQHHNYPIKQIIPRTAHWFDWLLILLLLISATAIALSKDYLTNITLLSVIGICTSLIFLIYGAPDVAITQLLVDILTIVIIVLALYRLPRLPKIQHVRKTTLLRNATIATISGLVISILLLAATSVPFNRQVTTYYVDHAYVLAHGRNIVNVILVDFRSLDTLGEILVVALAGLGVYGLLKTKPGRRSANS